MTRAVIFILVLIAFVWLVWMWGFCRFYVDPGEMAVVIAKTGADMPAGQMLADAGQKGIRKDVLGEGRHFLNPFFYEREFHKVIRIQPGRVGVVTSKIGDELPEGEFIAEPGQKGVLRGTLGPGTYRLNPYGYKVDIVEAIVVPIGYVGVLTSLSGEQAPSGEFAAAGQKGVRRDILQPGLYFINPKEYKTDVLEVGVNQVSLLGDTGSTVITKRQMAAQTTATDVLQRNVLQEQQQKRDEYLSNVAAQSIMPAKAPPRRQTPMEAKKSAQTVQLDEGHIEAEKFRAQKADALATFSLNQFVEFPSRDGFSISLDMTVEFELLPENIAWLFRSYGDLPAVVDKVILPQILSISRLKGSAYRAIDFIVGEGREKFQNDLTDALAGTLKEKKLIVNNALIRHVEVPMQILDPIQQASVAVEQDLTNKEMQNTARKQAELNTEQEMIEQRSQQVQQETEKLKAEINANKEKEVAEIKAAAMRSVAEIEKDTAGIRAEKTRMLGQAGAEVIRMVEGERAKGQLLKVKAFADPVAYSLWEFASNLAPELRVSVLHAGPGTLWTDLEKARLGDLNAAEALMRARAGGAE